MVEGNMEQHQYQRVLENRMMPQMRDWFPNEDGIFMHDLAPCHTAKRIKEFVRQNNIQVLAWPGNSPDINPIENLWGIMKTKLAQQTFNTRDELIRAVLNMWIGIEMAKQSRLPKHSSSQCHAGSKGLLMLVVVRLITDFLLFLLSPCSN